MAETFAAEDVEFDASDIEFDDEPTAQAQPAVESDQMAAFGRSIFEALKKATGSASPFEGVAGFQKIAPEAEKFALGAITGAKRQDTRQEAGVSEQAGQLLGRYGLPIGAALGASALAPALLPAASGPDATAVLSSAIQGAGTAAGEAAGVGLSKALGGEVPDTASEALGGAGKTGLTAAATDLGLSGAVGALKVVAPRFLQATGIIKTESLKKIIENSAKYLRGGKLTQSSAELRAAAALRNIQKAAETERGRLGKTVDNALESFNAQTKGAAIINTNKAAQKGLDVLAESSAGDDLLDAVLAPERKKIEEIINVMSEKPLRSAKETVNLRRMVDNLTRFKRGGVAEVSSEQGQRALHAIGSGLREGIDEAAKTSGGKSLLEANAAASKFYRGYDGIRKEISTKNSQPGTLVDKIIQIAGRYNSGGVKKDLIANLGKVLPEAAHAVEDLIGYTTAREFIVGVKKTPSGLGMAAWRSVFPALGLVKGLPAAQQAEKITRLLTRAGVAGAGSKINQK